MKLLKNERAYFRWMRTELSWSGVDAGYLRNYGPSAYPCFGYVGSVDCSMETDYPEFLYEADCETMLNDLRKAAG